MTTYAQIRRSKKARQRRVPHAVPPASSLPVPSRHPSNCLCADCHTAAQHYTDYQKQKALQELL
jgi:hypothetical protein